MVKVGQIFILLFMAMTFAFSGFFTVFGLNMFFRQYESQSFPSTEGRIVSSEMRFSGTTKRGAIIYKPALTYTYSVSGRDYTGQRYRYDDEPNDNDLVREIVARHPAGSPVEVYYNPSNPGDALLAPEVLSGDVLIVLLSGTFLSSTLLMLLKTGRDLDWPGGSVPTAGGVKIISELTGLRVRLPRFLPGTLGLVTVAILSFASAFLMKTAFNDAPLPAAWFIVGGILLAGMVAYFWQHAKIASGRQDLIIHALDRTVELPLTYQRRERWSQPFSTIAAVTLEKIFHEGRSRLSSTKDRSRSSSNYATILQLKDGTAERLTELNQERSEAFAVWLREKLGLPKGGNAGFERMNEKPDA